jgi:hypothetical protein
MMAAALVGGSVAAGTALAATTPQSAAPAVASPYAGPLPLARRTYLVPPAVKAHKARAVHHVHHVPRRSSRAHARAALTGSPQTIAHALVLRRGWSETQWGCLEQLWTRESNWRVDAQNRSGAYGIPQALPATKMAMMGSDWRTNPITQIQWGLWYIAGSYGTPCVALQHSNNYNYY